MISSLPFADLVDEDAVEVLFESMNEEDLDKETKFEKLKMLIK